MLVVGMMKNEPTEGKVGSNLLGLRTRKRRKWRTHCTTAERRAAADDGEYDAGRRDCESENGWAIAAFSGGKSEDDVEVQGRRGGAEECAVDGGEFKYEVLRMVSDGTPDSDNRCGRVAQLGERVLCKHEVAG